MKKTLSFTNTGLTTISRDLKPTSNEEPLEHIDVCYTVNSRLIDQNVNYHPCEDYEVFFRLHSNGNIEGETRMRYHKLDMFSPYSKENQKITEEKSIEGIFGLSQLIKTLNELHLDYDQFLEELNYGKERTRLRRFIEKLERDLPWNENKRVKLSESRISFNNQKDQKISFMHNDYLDCQKNPYREYYFTCNEKDEKFYKAILPIYAFLDETWKFPCSEAINASLEEAVKRVKKEIFVPSQEPQLTEGNALKDINDSTKAIYSTYDDLFHLFEIASNPLDNIDLRRPIYIQKKESRILDKTKILREINNQLAMRRF